MSRNSSDDRPKFSTTLVFIAALLVVFTVPGWISAEPLPTCAVYAKEQLKKPDALSARKMATLPGEPMAIWEGKRIFNIHCAQCHGDNAKGGGDVANLTAGWQTKVGDPGRTYERALSFITHGSPTKPMLAWKNRLSSQKLLQVSAFVFHLKTCPNEQLASCLPCK